TADRFAEAISRRLDQARRRLDDLATRRALRRPLERLRDHERRLDEWAERLRRAVQLHHKAASQRLAALAARLETLSPLNVLACYERGVGRLKRCYGQLKDAEQRIVLLAGTGEDGRPLVQPFEHVASAEMDRPKRPAKGPGPGVY